MTLGDSIMKTKIYGIIYKITNEVNGKVYIGQTTKKNGFKGRYPRKGSGIERVLAYLETAKKYDIGNWNKHLHNSIKKYGIDRFKVSEVIDVAFSREELNIKENFWINYYDSFKNGYNRNLGGDGSSGYEGFKGVGNPRSRAVIQLTLEGKFIRRWDYINQIKKELKIKVSHIGACCSGERPSCADSLWVYADEYDPNEEYKLKRKIYVKGVVQLSLKGKFIKEFESQIEAANELGISFRGINKCIKGASKSYKGYLWIDSDKYDKKKKYEYNVKNKGVNKPIYAFDKYMNFLGEYEKMNSVIEEFGYTRWSLDKVLHHKKSKVITEHIFIYKNEYENGIKEK